MILSLGLFLLFAAGEAAGQQPEAAADSGFRNNVLVITSLEALLLILLLVWYRLLARRRELDSTVRLPFASFGEGLDGLLKRLEGLAGRLRALPFIAPGSVPLAGRTLEAYQTIDALLAGVSRSWLEMMQVRRQIDTTLRSRAPLRAPALARLREQLNVRTVLEQAASDLASCEEALNELEHAPQEAGAMVEAIGNLFGGANRNLQELETAGLPAWPYEGERRAIEEGLARAQEVLGADPLGADRALQEVQSRAEALSVRSAQALYHRRGAEEAWAKLEEVANLAIALRRDGLLLAEDEANPDAPLRQARWEHDAARMALERGETDLTARHLEQSFSWSEKARQGMERHRLARAYCQAALADLNARAERYAAELERAAQLRSELSREHHPDGWADVALYGERAEALFASCRPLMVQVEECLEDSRQHYFRAEDLLLHVQRQMERGERFLSETEQGLQRLRAFRQGVMQGAQEIEALQAQALEVVGQGRHTLSEVTLARLEETQAMWKETRAAISRPQPDWPVLDRQARRVLAGFRDVVAQTGEESRAHDEAQGLLACLREQEGEVAGLLQRHPEQHRRASGLFEQTRSAFHAMETELARPHTDWLEAVSKLTALHDQFQRAARWISEDTDIARQAAQELGEAEEALRLAQSSCPLGMAGDASAAAEMIEAARRRLAEQKYGEALQSAEAAGAEARQAQQRALRETRRRQAQLRQQRVHFSFEAKTPAETTSRGPATASGEVAEPAGLFEGRPTFPSRAWSPADATATTEWASRPAGK